MNSKPSAIETDSNSIVQRFERVSGLNGVRYEIINRSDGSYLIFNIGNPTERMFNIVKDIDNDLSDNIFKSKITIKRKSYKPWIMSPEAKLLIKVISESMTVDNNSFKNDFFERYIETGEENQILSNGNHIVYGRRGSGKSSLLLYAMRMLTQNEIPCLWLSMQIYEKRKDNKVAIDMFRNILDQAMDFGFDFDTKAAIEKVDSLLRDNSEDIADDKVRMVIPFIKRALDVIIKKYGRIFIFIDDCHVLAKEFQPKLLSYMYSFSRGNNTFLKISAIETFSKIYDYETSLGLEAPNDAQLIRLDYNLTMPDQAKMRIQKILEVHAQYSGIPSLNVLCGKNLLSRLVWVSAGVPRDALNLFIQALKKSINSGHSLISLSSINLSAAEALDDKQRYISMDTSNVFEEELQLLERIKLFCTKQQKTNAFLVEKLNNNPTFEAIKNLVGLRFLHVISQSITPGEASRAYLALILDYGFYVGIKSTRSIDLFKSNFDAPPTYRELRGLPKFQYQ